MKYPNWVFPVARFAMSVGAFCQLKRACLCVIRVAPTARTHAIMATRVDQKLAMEGEPEGGMIERRVDELARREDRRSPGLFIPNGLRILVLKARRIRRNNVVEQMGPGQEHCSFRSRTEPSRESVSLLLLSNEIPIYRLACVSGDLKFDPVLVVEMTRPLFLWPGSMRILDARKRLTELRIKGERLTARAVYDP